MSYKTEVNNSVPPILGSTKDQERGNSKINGMKHKNNRTNYIVTSGGNWQSHMDSPMPPKLTKLDVHILMEVSRRERTFWETQICTTGETP